MLLRSSAQTEKGCSLLPLTERLREETRERHEALERRLDWRERMATPDTYLALIARWWGFHRVFEPAFARVLGSDLAQPRRKLHLLERDLRHFGLTTEAVASLPRFAPSDVFEERPAMLGALYVVEGSTLGGQVIARHLRQALGPAVAGGGCAYFEGYGKRETAPMWATLRAVLDRSVEDGQSQGVVDGALWTFDALADWLTGCAAPASAP